jgi:hypothetical protein
MKGRLFVVVAVVAAVLFAPVPRAKHTALMIGDSTLWESARRVVAQFDPADWNVTIRALSGASPCDLTPRLRHALTSDPHPTVIVLDQTANSWTSCMTDVPGCTAAPAQCSTLHIPLIGSDLFFRRYEQDLHRFLALAASSAAPVVVVRAPSGRNPWFAGVQARVVEMERRIAARYPNVSVVSGPARAVAAPDGSFSRTLPCLPHEHRNPQCVDGRIVVRASDGLHFCPVPVVAAVPPCPVYSSGEWRFARAVGAAARAAVR